MINRIKIRSNYLLGQSLLALLLDKKNIDEVFDFFRGINENGRHNFQCVSIDQTGESRLFEALERVKPEVFVKAATMKQLDQYEKEEYLSEEVNVKFVDYLAEVSQGVIKKGKKVTFNFFSENLFRTNGLAIETAEVFNLNKVFFSVPSEKLNQLARRLKIIGFVRIKLEKEFQLNFREFSVIKK